MTAILTALIAAAALLATEHPKNDYSKTKNWLCRPGATTKALAALMSSNPVQEARSTYLCCRSLARIT